jgi:hypothetical protein
MTVRDGADLRPPAHAGELGNEFGLVVSSWPWDDFDGPPGDNQDAHGRTRRSPEAGDLCLVHILGRGPKLLGDFANEIFGSRASVVMTNVVGPREPIYLAGVPIDRMMFWVPHPGRQLGMGISILSYQGKASLAVIADGRLVPDPEAITTGFNREFAQMLRRVKSKAKAV